MNSVIENVLDTVFPERRLRERLFHTAMVSSTQIQNLYKFYKEGNFEINLENQSFTKIFPHEDNSPAIHWIDDNQLIIRYPRFSKPYHHSFKQKCKFIECISGKIYDKNSDQKLFPGDRVKVEPNHNFEPYTLDEVCYLRVCLGDCASMWDQICK